MKLPVLKRKIVFNAPAVLTFAGLCFAVFLIDLLFAHKPRTALFSVYRSSLADPLTYLRFFGHALGHKNWEHLMNNMLYILMLGPMLEEKYGTRTMIFLMAASAFITGLFAFVFLPGTASLGASGIVFAMILMSSFTGFEEGTVPLSFLLVAVLYIGQQITEMITVGGNIGYWSHIVGGAVGAALGYLLNRRQTSGKCFSAVRR